MPQKIGKDKPMKFFAIVGMITTGTFSLIGLAIVYEACKNCPSFPVVVKKILSLPFMPV